MKGLDTNVLIRYLTQDDPRQSALASREIEASASRGEKFLLQPLVLCELVWVLESAYHFSKADLVNVLERILRTSQFEVAEKEVLWRALNDYRPGKGDFSDYYLGRTNQKHGAETTLTFDRALRDDPGFQVLK